MTPTQIIANQNEAGLRRALAAATHVWPKGRQMTRPIPAEDPPPPERPPERPAASGPTVIKRDLSLNPDTNAIDGVAVTVAATVAPVATVARGTVATKILSAMNEQPGRWYTVYDLVVATGAARATVAKAAARLVERMPQTIVRMADGPQSYRYRLINSLSKKGI